MIKKNTLISSVVLALALGVLAGWVLHYQKPTGSREPKAPPPPPPLVNGSHIKATGGSLTLWSNKDWTGYADNLQTSGTFTQISFNPPLTPATVIPQLGSGWHLEMDFYDSSGLRRHPDESHVKLADIGGNRISVTTTNKPKKDIGSFSLNYTLTDPAKNSTWYGRHYEDGKDSSKCQETCNHLKTIYVYINNKPETHSVPYQCPNGQCEIDLQ